MARRRIQPNSGAKLFEGKQRMRAANEVRTAHVWTPVVRAPFQAERPCAGVLVATPSFIGLARAHVGGRLGEEVWIDEHSFVDLAQDGDVEVDAHLLGGREAPRELRQPARLSRKRIQLARLREHAFGLFEQESH